MKLNKNNLKKITRVDRINNLTKSLVNQRDSYSKLTSKINREICKGLDNPELDIAIQQRNIVSTTISQTEQMISNLKDSKCELGDALNDSSIKLSDFD